MNNREVALAVYRHGRRREQAYRRRRRAQFVKVLAPCVLLALAVVGLYLRFGAAANNDRTSQPDASKIESTVAE